MAKITIRDRVWDAALRVAREKAEEGPYVGSFNQQHVAAAMEDPPSAKTIRETLQSMAALGHLSERYHGKYRLADE